MSAPCFTCTVFTGSGAPPGNPLDVKPGIPGGNPDGIPGAPPAKAPGPPPPKAGGIELVVLGLRPRVFLPFWLRMAVFLSLA